NKLKRFAKDTIRYEGGKWTKSGAVNKMFAPELRKFTVDATQTVAAIHKGADRLRTASRAAAEIYSDVQWIINEGESEQNMQHILEKVKRLTIYGFATSKELDGDAKDLTTRALRLPTSVRYLEDTEEDSHSLPINNQPRATTPVPRNPVPTTNNVIVPKKLQKSSKTTDNSKTTKTANKYENTKTQKPTLHHPTRWYSTGRSPLSFSGQLETTDNSSMAVVGYRAGLQITIPVQPSPMEIETNPIISHRSTSSRQCSRKIQDSSSDKEIAQPRSELLIPVLYDKRTEQNPTNSRLSYNQPISSMSTFQDGRSTCSQRNSRGWRLYGKDRFEGCICCSANQSRISKIPHISSSRYSLPISIPPFWIECGPEVVLKTDEVCSRTIQKKGNSLSILPRRYLFDFKDETRIEGSHSNGIITLNTIRFSDKLGEERFRTKTNTRFSRIHIQHEEHADHSPSGEDEQINVKNQTIGEDYGESEDVHMPLDCRIIGENDFINTSHRRNTTTPALLTKGFSGESKSTTIPMGQTMHIISQGNGRIDMVENLGNSKEWATTSKTNRQVNSTGNNNTRRCLRLRMGSSIANHRNVRLLVPGRKRTINQCERTEDNPVCTSTTQRKIQKLHHPNFFGQHNSNQICSQEQWNSISNFARTSFGDTGDSSGIQHSNQDTTHTCIKEYHSRSAEQNNETSLRMDTTPQMVQQNSTDMEQKKDRRICFENQHQITNILEFSSRPPGSRRRCLQTDLAQERSLSSPTVEVNPVSSEKIQTRQSQRGNSGNTKLDGTILVAHGAQEQQRQDDNADKQDPLFDRLAIIQQHQGKDGLNQQTQDNLKGANRSGTQRQYNSHWKKWVIWNRDKQPPSDSLQYSLKGVIEFLVESNNMSYSTLNGMRSAIASVYKVIHPTLPPLASHTMILQFFEAKRRKDDKLPNIHTEAFDVQLLINHVVAWGKSEELELFTLQQKTITLITIATMWRPRSDIGNLQWRDVEFVMNDGNTEPIGVTLKVRQPKEIKPKASKLGALQDKTKCPVHTLWVFCQATLEGRKYLTQDHKLFLKGLHGDSETEWESVATGTIASWLKKIMDSAGIDTEKYTVHSIRAAASTKAVDLGMSFETVKDHANWSQNSSTFENYYYRPRD
ncbi:hypothetical protein INT47_008410, partial [Mucor saturninus]